jgi:drug/metabolite transporter (DMT)-like permease
MTKNSGALSLLIVGILYGLSGPLAKYLSEWLNPYQVVGLRFTIAFLLALAIFIITKKKLNLKALDKKTVILFALSFPISAIFFTLSVFFTKVSLAVFSFYISNLISSFILGKLIFKEKIDLHKSIALIFVGIALICFTNPLEGFTLSLGLLFGIISGILQTIASIFQKKIGESTDRFGLVMIQTGAGVLTALIAMTATNTLLLPALPLTAIFISILFGVMFLAISYLMLIGFQKTNLNVGSLLVSTELFFGPLFAFLMFQETLTSLELFGGALTIVAIIIVNLKN